MNVLTGDLFAPRSERQKKSSFSIHNTEHGIVITKCSGQITLVENLFRMLGVGCALYSAIHLSLLFGGYVLFEDFAHSDGVLGELLAAITIAFSGVVLYLFGRRGFRRQLQIDPTKNELRIGYQGIDGRLRQIQRIPFASIGSVFLHRSKAASHPARLSVRPKDGADPITLLSGPVKTLEPILEEITRITKLQTSHLRARSHGN